ncbi:MAG: ATP synthase F1 subunit epsilon [Flavobacteriales bacterium]|nr:ATP synthase F1 subunit epsilon [Flavobacteriales bacterium]MCB9203475.1 ATP synthase F1 subunit epsilon [Flavobacteriales bacterium]
MQLEIVTPDQKLFEGEVRHVQLPGKQGLFGILDNHAPIVSTLVKGRIKVEVSGGDIQLFEIEGGVVEMNNNKVIVLAES